MIGEKVKTRNRQRYERRTQKDTVERYTKRNPNRRNRAWELTVKELAREEV